MLDSFFALLLCLPLLPPCLSTGLTLCHRETEGIHRAGGQDSASRIGQRWQDHPAEKPRLWGCEHYHANAGERKLCVQKAVCIRSITLEHMLIIVFSSPCLNQFNFNISSRCSLLYVYQVKKRSVCEQFSINTLLISSLPLKLFWILNIM